MWDSTIAQTDIPESSLLDRIASALNRPIGDFLAQTRQDELQMLVEQFQRLKCPEARRRCLAFVQAEADQVGTERRRAEGFGRV